MARNGKHPDPPIDMRMPMDLQAERATIGALLLTSSIEPEAVPAIAKQCSTDDFAILKHAWIFDAAWACWLRQEAVDLSTVASELDRQGHLQDVGGMAFLGELTSEVPTAWSGVAYARNVAMAALRRRLIQESGKIAALGYDQRQDIGAVLSQIRTLTTDLEREWAATQPQTSFTAAELDKMEFAPVRWAVPDILPEGLTLLCGKPKMGKSWLVYALALAIAHGGRALGQVAVEQGDVLYLSLEDPKRRLQSRQRKLLDGADPPRRLTLDTDCPPLGHGAESKIADWIERQPQARLVILDTFAKVKPDIDRDGNLYDSDCRMLKGIKKLADDYRLAVVVVHHLRKLGADDILDQVLGSQGVVGTVDNILILARERGQADAVLHVTGRDIEQDGEKALKWDQMTAQWTLLGDAAEYRLSQTRQVIVGAMREAGAPVGIKELADMLESEHPEMTYNAVKQRLFQMQKVGQVKSINGKYELVPGANQVSSA